MHVAQDEEDDLLKRFWELDSDPPSTQTKFLTEEEEQCEKFFLQTTKRDDSGKYIVKLPFKMDDPPCKYGDSRKIAYRRLLMLERRLAKDAFLKKEYSEVIKEYLSLGHMEKVPLAEVNNPHAVYLPHHAVVRQERVTTKVRVVFDATCVGSNGASLNKDMMVGPKLQADLRHQIMRWRKYPIALVADIVKMYRQVKVDKQDTDFQRILWREDPSAEIQHLRLLRVTFGTSSAPYLAVRCLQQVSIDEGTEFPLASTRVLNDFYVDDLMTGCYSVEEGLQIYEQMTELLERGGFPLQKWASNDKRLLKHITEDKKHVDKKIDIKTDEVMKILGLVWNKDKDEFKCTVKLPELVYPVTKRKVISDIARLFDPLGWLAPVVTTAKVFLQKLWLSGIAWDDELPPNLLSVWLSFRNDLTNLSEISFPRWISTSNIDTCIELHGFSDASNVAYAAVVYARVFNKDGSIKVALIASKTRVAPIKQVSIPRLELCGAVLLARLLSEISNVLNVQKNQIHAWTDSSVVLAWLRSHPSRWKTFIANRVSEILTVMDAGKWSHVRSSDNPADCASRGISPSDCVNNQLWFQGPCWLLENEICYNSEIVEDTNLEEKKIKLKCCTALFDDSILCKYSSLKKLIRVLAYCRRVVTWKKGEMKIVKPWLMAKELELSMLTCIKLCQGKCFQEDLEELRKNGKVSKKSKLTSLNPFIDGCDVLRVGGRLQRAQFEEDMMHPIIIPHTSHFTDLLIADAHKKTMHGGPQLMLNYLRTKYWIIGAKALVKQHVHKCVSCIRQSGKISNQMMGELPMSRVTPNRPFHRSGVDFAGPISIRATKGRGYRSTKGYICLFICMAIRAIHLEVVSDMTTEGFIAAFKRFVARRGHVAEIWSDNGTNFVGAARELKELFDVERSYIAVEIANWLESNGTSWHFIPPHSPNFGGLWEAGVKSTKHHLRRVIGNTTLTFEEMTTTLAQIEACLNSRPISQLSNSPEDPFPLTPGHFLVGEPLVLVPEFNFEKSNISSLKRWQLSQRLVQDFWRRWAHEYLTQLQQRHKWNDKISEPGVGDVVLVKEDNLPPSRWLYGLIVDKHPGLDKFSRVFSIKYKDSIIKRPLSKLIVLPVNT